VFFAAAAALGAFIYMTNEKPAVRPRIDWTGTVLASAGLFGLVFGFSHAETAGWTSVVTMTSMILGVVLLVAFVFAEQRVASPLLPLRVVSDRTRAVAFVAVGLAGIAMFGVFLFLTYYLQNVKGFSPVESGFAFLPMIVCVMIASNLSNIVTLPRFGPRIVITIGMLLGFLAMGYLSQIDVGSSYVGGVLPSLIVMGFAMGMVMAPSMNTATAGVQPQDSGVAAALVSTMQQVGGSIGTAVLSTITATVTTNYLASHDSGSNLQNIAATHGYAVIFAISAFLFLGGAVMGATLFPSKAKLTAMREAAAGGAAQNAEQKATETEDEVIGDIVAVDF
jgi:predicted MFS family arabinose efflux permease